MKHITLCADDFAQSIRISEGILQLVTAGRLGAVSCMTDSPAWPEMAARLKAVPGHHQAGLHFNLTHNFNGTHGSISHLLLDSLKNNLNPHVIRSFFIRQWDAFVKHYGQPPAFVDGHQHVHVLPVIRNIVLEETARRNPYAWVRLPETEFPSLKGLLIRGVATGFKHCLQEAGLAFNRSFAGYRPFKASFDFAHFMRKTLATSGDGTLVMCHPGLAEDDPEDPIASSRQGELDYLGSGRFLLDLASAGVTQGGAMGGRPYPHTVQSHCPSPV